MVTRSASPQALARAGGVLYLVVFAMAGIGICLQSKLVLAGDAAATASHTLGAQTQWRMSIAAETVTFLRDIPLAVIFFILFRPVNEPVVLVSGLFRFAEPVMGCTKVTLHAMPLNLLGGTTIVASVPAEQLHAFAHLSLQAYDFGWDINLIPFWTSVLRRFCNWAFCSCHPRRTL